MQKLYQLIATFFGIGYIAKGGGTVASVVCCIAWYFIRPGNEPEYIRLMITGLLFATGVWSAGKMEAKWGKDSYRVVIDEVTGMCCTLLFIPLRWQYVVCGLVLFRFFDIIKPLYIRRMEALKGGWGVMMDDMLAGIYSNLILQLVVLIKLW